jgi:hypothetical protein
VAIRHLVLFASHLRHSFIRVGIFYLEKVALGEHRRVIYFEVLVSLVKSYFVASGG